MTVCLNDDIYHPSMETLNQSHMDCNEVDVTIEHIEISSGYGVPVTLFATGKAAREDTERGQHLTEMDHKEIWGHIYWVLDTTLHTLFLGLNGSWYGSRWSQQWKNWKTVRALEDLAVRLRLWRNHPFRHGENAAQILPGEGFNHFSTIVDQFVRNDEFEGPFGNMSVPPDHWLVRTRETMRDQVDSDRVATIRVHMVCLDIVDGLAALETLYRAGIGMGGMKTMSET